MKLNFEVRDYECDVQGIVNNAVYLQYLEHARHKFLLSHNVDFVELSRQNKNLVVRDAHYTYYQSLRPDDQFYVETRARAEGKVKIVFEQKIFKSEELVLSAEITGVCVDAQTNKIFKISDILTPDLFES
tara:strand:- start:106 stop:495 length:390 start_codon:yes stop_codon:yes gene_type:complete